MKWNINSEAPVYRQLILQLETAFVTGGYAPGQRLPGVRDLAAEAGVNPNTMQRALQDLESRGLLCTQRTAGRSVTADAAVLDALRRQKAAEAAHGYLKSMAGLGYTAAEAESLLGHIDEAGLAGGEENLWNRSCKQ